MAVPILGLLAFQRGAVWNDAAALWTDAMRKGPDMARPRLMLGQLAAAGGRHEEAIPLFVGALERDPGFIAGYRALAASQQVLGRGEDAVATALHATRAAPRTAQSWALLADMARMRAQAAPDSAAAAVWYERSAQAYVEALSRDPDVAAYHDNLGNTLQLLGRPEAALAHHRRALELAPAAAASYLNLGNALWMLGRTAEAEGAWRHAVAVDASYEPAWRSLEALYARRGDAAGLQQVRRRSLGELP